MPTKKKRGMRGEGSLFQRQDGYWVFQLRHRGKTYTEFLGTTDEKEADRASKAVKRRIIGDVAKEDVTPGARSNARLERVLEDYIEFVLEHRKSGQIIEQVLRSHFVDGELVNRKVSSITTADLRRYSQQRSLEGAESATIKNELAYLRAAFNHGRKLTPPTVGIVPYFPIPAVDNTRTGFLDVAHYKALLDELPDSLKLSFVVAYHVGDRKGELLAIDVEQVEFDDGFIVIDKVDTKNNTGRNLPIYGDMGKWLRWQLEIRKKVNPGHTKLFFWHPRDVGLNHGGNRVAPGSPMRNFTASWNAAVERMVTKTRAKQYTGLLFHDLRRSAVRNMIQKAKIPEAQAMKISGHKTPSMLYRYNIVARQDVADAGKKLNTWMDGELNGDQT